MAAFYAEAGYAWREAEARRALTALLADPALGRVWIAERGGAAVAYAVLTLGFSLEYLGRDAFVDELYVRPEARRGGLARAAFDHMEAACRELGVGALHLEVEHGNDPAAALYRERGFADDGRRLWTRRLDAESRARVEAGGPTDASPEELAIHRGGCHCGRVRFEIRAPARLEASACNCSICARVGGFLHVIVPPERFRLLQGGEELLAYRFGTGAAEHLFCRVCGVKSFYVPRSHPDGFSVSARCLDPGSVESLRVTPFDGEHWEDAIHTLRGAE